MTATIPTTYKAYTYDTYGAMSDHLKLNEVKTQPLSAHSVRIQVHSAALNLIDYNHDGSTPTKDKPNGFGFDVAGTIIEVGVGVHSRHFKVGDGVYAMASLRDFGTVAEHVEIDQQYVALKPTNLDFVQAAGVPLVALTSYQALYEYTQLKNGSNQRC